LTKEQKEDFTNQYRQETENYNEMIRKKKLDLLSEEELAQLKKIKQSRKNIGGMSNFEGLVNLFFFIAIIVIWYIYWCIIRPIPVQFPEVLQGTSEA
jgi:oligoribonuclease NrnB/cAMP/cGMP phosphodiesterase (DHH superfamily)